MKESRIMEQRQAGKITDLQRNLRYELGEPYGYPGAERGSGNRPRIWTLALALAGIGFIIFAVLFNLGNAFAAMGNLVQILFTGFAAIYIIVIAIGIAPWLNHKSY
jgi:hypothetical protein